MRYYFAPMEGVTDARFRSTHRQFFPGIDEYWTPFWAVTQSHVLTARVLRDFLPKKNAEIPVRAQLLTKSSEDFLWAAAELAAMGYREVNLNLGCPSGTVTAKGKGAGFLADLPRLERFLDEIFAASALPISIKTRLGIHDPEEFGPILELFHRYPVTELIVHARVQQDFYKQPVRWGAFAAVMQQCSFPICYNGDLKTETACNAFFERFPEVESVMIGRGLMADPALVSKLKGGPAASRQALQGFNEALFAGYLQDFGSERNVMLRMKAHWSHLIFLFEDRDGYAKRLRKSSEPREFEALTVGALRDLPLLDEAVVNW